MAKEKEKILPSVLKQMVNHNGEICNMQSDLKLH